MIGDWLDIGWLNEIPVRGSRTVTVDGGEEIAVFRTGDDQVFALVNRCPHKGGPLSQGIVHSHSVVCPLHNWTIALATGNLRSGPVVRQGKSMTCHCGERRGGMAEVHRLTPGLHKYIYHVMFCDMAIVGALAWWGGSIWIWNGTAGPS